MNNEASNCYGCGFYGPNVRLVVGSGYLCEDCFSPRTFSSYPQLKEWMRGALDARPVTITTLVGILKDAGFDVPRNAVARALGELCYEGFAGFIWAPPKGSLFSARHYYEQEAFTREHEGEDPFAGLE